MVRSRSISILGNFNFRDVIESDYSDSKSLASKYTIAGKYGAPGRVPDNHFNQAGHNLIASEVIKHLEKEIENGTLKL